MKTGDITHRGYKIGEVCCRLFAVAPDGRHIEPEPWDGRHGQEAALDRMRKAIDQDIESCCRHDWRATSYGSGGCVLYVCRHCGAEEDRDVS